MRGRYWDNPSRSGPPEFPRSFVQDKFELRDELQVTVLFSTAGDCLFPRQPTVLFLTVLFSTVVRPITGSPESPNSFVQDKFELRDELQVPQPTVLFPTDLFPTVLFPIVFFPTVLFPTVGRRRRSSPSGQSFEFLSSEWIHLHNVKL